MIVPVLIINSVMLIFFPLWANIAPLKQMETELFQVKAHLRSLDLELQRKQEEFQRYDSELNKITQELKEQSILVNSIKKKALTEYEMLKKQIDFYYIKSSQTDPLSVMETTALSRLIGNWKMRVEEVKLLMIQANEHATQLLQLEWQQKQISENVETLQQLLVSRNEDKLAKLDRMKELEQQVQQQQQQKIEEQVHQYQKQLLASLETKAFIPPLKSFSYQRKDQGVNFKAQAGTLITAPRDGEVVYVGELANYGRVVLINHDQQYKSILLAPAEWKVFVGQKVIKGDPLGTLLTAANDLPGQEVYFEVRKGKVPLDTLPLIQWN